MIIMGSRDLGIRSRERRSINEMERVQVDEQRYGLPLLTGFLGLMISWVVFGFFLSGVVLAIVCVIIAIVAAAGGYAAVMMRKR
jgi:hypothetical protein